MKKGRYLVTLLAILLIVLILLYIRKPVGFQPDSENRDYGPLVELDGIGLLAPVGSTISGTNSVTNNNGVYSFSYVNGSDIIEYVIDSNDFATQRGILLVKETSTGIFPISWGGTTYKDLTGNGVWPTDIPNRGQVVMSNPILQNNVLSLHYTDVINGISTERQYDLTIRGKTLIVYAYAINPRSVSLGNYDGFVIGSMESVSNAKHIEIPYSENAPIIISGPLTGRSYVTAYADLTMSGSNTWWWFHSTQEQNRYHKFLVPKYIQEKMMLFHLLTKQYTLQLVIVLMML